MNTLLKSNNEPFRKCEGCHVKLLETYFDKNKKGEILKCCNKCRQKRKEYREKHKEEMRKYREQYNETNKGELREKAKEYYNNNIEERQEYNSKYRKEHREEILEKAKEKIECERCGARVCKIVMKRHQRSQKCCAGAKARTATSSSSGEQAP